MPIELNDVFAIMRGEKKIRDVTNPDVADALTGQDVSGDVLKIGNNLQSVPKETPILGTTSNETGGAIFTDQKTLGQSKQTTDVKSEIERDQYNQQLQLKQQQEQQALRTTPRILRSAPATPSTPLSIDPDIIKNTAFRYTAGVTKQTDKQAFYDAHAMLTGSQQFDANKYIQTRLILEKQAAAGNKGASYYLNEFDTYFALKASEFVVSGPLAALDARDTQEAQVNVRKALADVFGGDAQLQEAFLRSGGMESFNNALKQAREYAGDNVSAENLRLERESLRAKTDQSRATAVSKIRGSGSYSPTGSVSYAPTLSGKDRTATVNSINNIVNGGGDTVAALNDFKGGLSSTAPTSREPFVFQDIGTVVDSLQGGRYASVQDVEQAIITAYEKTGNEVTDQNRNALFRAVVGYDDGHAFDAISEEIIAQANGVLRATDNGFIEQWANIENTTGDIQGLSASLGDKPIEKYAEYLDKAIQEEMNASAIEGSSTDDESVKQRARIAATRKVLMDVTGGGGEYMLPATEDQLAGADPRIQEIYAMVGNKLDEVDSSRSAYRTSRINYANGIVAKAQGQDAVKNQNYISIEYGDKDVIIPEGTIEDISTEIIKSQDSEARQAFEASIGSNGILDTKKFMQFIADRSVDGVFRILDSTFSFNGFDEDTQVGLTAWAARLNPMAYGALKDHETFLVGAMPAESMSKFNAALGLLDAYEAKGKNSKTDEEKLQDFAHALEPSWHKAETERKEGDIYNIIKNNYQIQTLLMSGSPENRRRGAAVLMAMVKYNAENNANAFLNNSTQVIENYLAPLLGANSPWTKSIQEEIGRGTPEQRSMVLDREASNRVVMENLVRQLTRSGTYTDFATVRKALDVSMKYAIDQTTLLYNRPANELLTKDSFIETRLKNRIDFYKSMNDLLDEAEKQFVEKSRARIRVDRRGGVIINQ